MVAAAVETALSTPPVASPDLPGVVLVGRTDGIEVSLPELDAQGRVLLGPTERGILGAIGWQESHHVFARLLSDGDEAADLVTRILIEVLEVAIPQTSTTSCARTPTSADPDSLLDEIIGELVHGPRFPGLFLGPRRGWINDERARTLYVRRAGLAELSGLSGALRSCSPGL